VRRHLRKIVRHGNDRLDRVRRAGGDRLQHALLILVGAGMSGAHLSEACPVGDSVIVDDDIITETTLMVPSYTEPGAPKAAELARRRNHKLPHCRAVAFVGRAEWLGQGFWAYAAQRGAVILDCVDRAATRLFLARMATLASLPMVTTGLGGRRVAVRAWPADPHAACARCLGLPDSLESESCTGRPLNLPDPDPTIAVIGAGALAGALAVEMATGLITGRITEAVEVRADLTNGLSVWRSTIPAAPDCDHRPAQWLAERDVCATNSEVPLGQFFARAKEELGAQPVLLLEHTEQRLECPCGHVEERLWAMQRHFECPQCGGTSVIGTARGPTEITEDLLPPDGTPASLGLPLWPILTFRAGRRQVHYELRGDAPAVLGAEWRDTR